MNTPLRFPDEFARHKILDIMGDFYLLGRPDPRPHRGTAAPATSDNIALLRVVRERFGLPALRGV